MNGMHGNLVFALVVSAIASLATTGGSLIGLAVRRPGPKLMALALGFSAGVMMFVSFAELLTASIATIGFLRAVIAFFGGMALMFAIDVAVPHIFVTEGQQQPNYCGGPSNLLRTGLLIAIGIAIHNLPEGMATFAGSIKSRGLGIAIASAIALHNIPEGLAVSMPVYCATGSRRKALVWSSLSGASELLGAGLAALILMPFLTPTFLAIVLAAVAGLMVFISFDELIPGSYAYKHDHLSVAGIVLGMAVMAVSLLFLNQ
jgi:zinc transporter, ZIP family